MMKTVSEVTKLTGISARTLQYYDEIGLLKPSDLTSAGYRLYDDNALEKLQQILFLKELGFQLKEINEFISHPHFDKIPAYKKQKELFLLKRNRIDRLIQLLSHLEKGEKSMNFKEFDLTDYIDALENFKKNSTDAIIKYWGSIENFDLFINIVKTNEPEVAKRAIKEFGSIEKYTEAMKYNLEHFTENMEQQMTGEAQEIVEGSDKLYARLTADISKDIASAQVQDIVQEIEAFICKNATAEITGNDYLNVIIDTYSNDYIKAITDTKYCTGASDYIVKAFQYYLNHKCGVSIKYENSSDIL